MSPRNPTPAAIIFREARLRAGLTQRELAEKLEVTPCSVYNYERGTTFPSERVLFGIFDTLGIDAREFFKQISCSLRQL